MIATVTTDVAVANLALDLIGCKAELASLTDGSQEAAVCTRHLPVAREACLAMADWPFAHRTAVLEEADAELADWDHAYVFPDDASAVWGIYPDARRVRPAERIPFDLTRALVAVEGSTATRETVIGCDVEPEIVDDEATGPVVVYTEQLTSPADWPAWFVDLVVAQLAVRIAMPLAVDLKKRLVAKDALVEARRAAIAYAEGQRTRDQEPDDAFTAARG